MDFNDQGRFLQSAFLTFYSISKGYLNAAMNESIVKYERCLAKFGYPHEIQHYLQGDITPINTNNYKYPHLMDKAETELKTRSCSIINSYIYDCQHLLSTCLRDPTMEIIRTEVDILEIVHDFKVLLMTRMRHILCERSHL